MLSVAPNSSPGQLPPRSQGGSKLRRGAGPSLPEPAHYRKGWRAWRARRRPNRRAAEVLGHPPSEHMKSRPVAPADDERSSRDFWNASDLKEPVIVTASTFPRRPAQL